MKTIEPKNITVDESGNLENVRAGVMSLGFIGIFGAAVAIALNAFRDTLTANGYAHNVTSFGLTGVANATSYLGTIGTLLGVGAIISVVVGAFWLARQ